MKLTKDQKQELLAFKSVSGSDDILYKETIKKKLIDNPLILYSLDATDIDQSNPAAYLDTVILPWYIFNSTETQLSNYLCFETKFTEIARYNDRYKLGEVIFYIVCDKNKIKEPITGIARHDLIAGLLTKEFNWSNCFGQQLHLVSDSPGNVDGNYVSRILVFEQQSLNNLSQPTKIDGKYQGHVVNNIVRQ